MDNGRVEIKDVFKDYKGKESGLDKQTRFLFAKQSLPLICPACGKQHTVNQLHVKHPSYKRNNPKTQHFSNFICPETKAKLKHDMTLIGGEDSLSLVPDFYYEWGDEPAGHVSTGCYVNDVLKNTGTVPRTYAVEKGLEFHNPHS